MVGMVSTVVGAGLLFEVPFALLGTYPAVTSGSFLLFQFLEIGALELALVLYLVLVPMPVPDLVLPRGTLELHHALRTQRVPWSRVAVVGSRLILVPRRWGVTTTYSVDRLQAERLSRFAVRPPGAPEPPA